MCDVWSLTFLSTLQPVHHIRRWPTGRDRFKRTFIEALADAFNCTPRYIEIIYSKWLCDIFEGEFKDAGVTTRKLTTYQPLCNLPTQPQTCHRPTQQPQCHLQTELHRCNLHPCNMARCMWHSQVCNTFANYEA